MDAGARRAVDRLWAAAKAATPAPETPSDEEWDKQVAAWDEMDPDGLRLWLSAMNETALEAERERARVISSAVALTDNDRCILSAMLGMGATGVEIASGADIVESALYKGDPKQAFRRVIDAGFVGSRTGRGGGYWLTEAGIRVARYIASA